MKAGRSPAVLFPVTFIINVIQVKAASYQSARQLCCSRCFRLVLMLTDAWPLLVRADYFAVVHPDCIARDHRRRRRHHGAFVLGLSISSNGCALQTVQIVFVILTLSSTVDALFTVRRKLVALFSFL